MASSTKTKKLINTTGKAYVATMQNGKIASEKPVTMKMGTVVEQVGNPVAFMDIVYFYDATGKLYNMNDFADLAQEVVLTPNAQTVAKTDNTIY